MLEILVGLTTLWILKRFFPHNDPADGTAGEILPLIDPHGHGDGGAPFSFVDDDFDSDWDTALIDELLDEGDEDEFMG